MREERDEYPAVVIATSVFLAVLYDRILIDELLYLESDPLSPFSVPRVPTASKITPEDISQ